jgi:hypothetical protein
MECRGVGCFEIAMDALAFPICGEHSVASVSGTESLLFLMKGVSIVMSFSTTGCAPAAV